MNNLPLTQDGKVDFSKDFFNKPTNLTAVSYTHLVEDITFEEVDYWDEVCKIMDWAEQNVTSTLHICWGAQAGFYHYYGIQKRLLPEKLFGLYSHKVQNRKIPVSYTHLQCGQDICLC